MTKKMDEKFERLLYDGMTNGFKLNRALKQWKRRTDPATIEASENLAILLRDEFWKAVKLRESKKRK